MTTLNLTCSGSTDHGAEQGGLNSVNSAASIRTNTEYSGHRFASATLASTDTINTAVPQIYDTYGTTLTFSMTVYCEAADNAAVYTTTAYSISSRAATTSPTAWTGTKPASPTYVTLPDITSHVTQVTGRGGWSSGNALNMIIRGNGGVRAVAPDGTAHPAKLDIDYTAGGGGATVKTLAATGVGG